MAKFFDKSLHEHHEFAWAHYGQHADGVMYAEWLSHHAAVPRQEEIIATARPMQKAPPPCFSEDDYEATLSFLRRR